ncbi:hypothetical protein DBR40_08610 [Pedobacter sp. KBW01]|nr:hypothetical protein DBR40_08610 [Pedobacter sp. KBW01]
MLSATFSFISLDFDFTLSELTSQKLSNEYLYQIAGLAIACEGLRHINIKLLCIELVAFNTLDECFIQSCFKVFEKYKIKIIDYLICNPNS